jgi:hypothetical protein
MMPQASRAKGTLYGVVDAMIFLQQQASHGRFRLESLDVEADQTGIQLALEER